MLVGMVELRYLRGRRSMNKIVVLAVIVVATLLAGCITINLPQKDEPITIVIDQPDTIVSDSQSAPTPKPFAIDDYPVIATFNIEDRDNPGTIVQLSIKLAEGSQESGYAYLSASGDKVVGTWKVVFAGTETYIYDITAGGDTTTLHLKKNGVAELHLPDGIEEGYWTN